MKEFCKNHKRQLVLVIFYLVYVYVACYIVYTIYTPCGDYYTHMPTPPPRWTQYLEFGKLYLPGLFMILAWISLINQKYGWYAFLTLIVLGNLYWVKYMRVSFWLKSEKTFGNVEYFIVSSVFFLVSLFYLLGKKKQWVYWVSNIAVFFVAISKELKVLPEVFCRLIEVKPNLLAVISYFPHRIVDTFLFAMRYCLRTVSSNILKKDIGLENFLDFMISVRKRILFSDKYLNWIFESKVGDVMIYCPDYYWYIRIFLLASILILGIMISYSKFSNQKDKILVEKKKLS